jgi:hypothetical protein
MRQMAWRRTLRRVVSLKLSRRAEKVVGYTTWVAGSSGSPGWHFLGTRERQEAPADPGTPLPLAPFGNPCCRSWCVPGVSARLPLFVHSESGARRCRRYRVCLKAVARQYRNRGGRGDGEIP